MFLQNLKGNFIVFEKNRNQPVPLMLQGFVHGKGAVRNTGGTGELLLLEFQVHKHAGDVLGRKTAAGILQGTPLVFRRKHKNKLKAQRGMAALN